MITDRRQVEHLLNVLRATGSLVSARHDIEGRISSVVVGERSFTPLCFAEWAIAEVSRLERNMTPFQRHLLNTPGATVSETEYDFLQRVGRWGSDAYGAAKRGRSWWVPCCPSGFKTKREAYAFVERYVDILLDKNAGREPGTTAVRRETEAAARARGEAVS